MTVLELLFSKAGNLNSRKGIKQAEVKDGFFSAFLNEELKPRRTYPLKQRLNFPKEGNFFKISKALGKSGDKIKELKVTFNSSFSGPFRALKVKKNKQKGNLFQTPLLQLGGFYICFSPYSKEDNKTLNLSIKSLAVSKREFNFSDLDQLSSVVVFAKTFSLESKAESSLKEFRFKSPKKKVESNQQFLSAGKISEKFELSKPKKVLEGWSLDSSGSFKIREQKFAEFKSLKEEKTARLNIHPLKNMKMNLDRSQEDLLKKEDLKANGKSGLALPFVFKERRALRDTLHFKELKEVHFLATNSYPLKKWEKVPVKRGNSKVDNVGYLGIIFNKEDIQGKSKTGFVLGNGELKGGLLSYFLVSSAILELSPVSLQGDLKLKKSPVLYSLFTLKEKEIGKFTVEGTRKKSLKGYFTLTDRKKYISNDFLREKRSTDSFLKSPLESKNDNVSYYFLAILEKEKVSFNENSKSNYSFNGLMNSLTFTSIASSDFPLTLNQSEDKHTYSLKHQFSYFLADFKRTSEKNLALVLKNRDLFLRFSLRSGKVLNLSLSFFGSGHFDGGELLSEITSVIRSSGFIPGKVYLKLKNKAFSGSEKRDRLELKV